MIYTVTFNPALDYVVTVNHFTPEGSTGQSGKTSFMESKGINVSALLANLGYQSTALGFVAGFTGDEIERGVKKLGFQSDFIKAEKGMSRINVKLKSDEESEINGMGPEITAGDVKAFLKSCPIWNRGMSRCFPEAFRPALTRISTSASWRCLMAGESGLLWMRKKDLLLNVLKYHPFHDQAQ